MPGVAEAAAQLRAGGVVAFPTETVYGLGADAFNERAVARVFELKGRPRFDPLIVHVAETADVETVASAFPAEARRLAEAFWPGPLTLVLPKREAVPDLVTAGLGTVGVRRPGHETAQALIAAAQTPIAAPSANRFGRISPTTAQHVRAEFGDAVGVLDGGPCATGVESTVVSLTGEPVVLRLGGVAVEAIEAVLGRAVAVARPKQGGDEAEEGRASPGMLERHYAPGTRLVMVEDAAGLDPAGLGARVGLLALDAEPGGGWAAVEDLGGADDLAGAAARLFAAMRRLDEAGLDAIVAVRVPDRGLGRAINDRLRRASL